MSSDGLSLIQGQPVTPNQRWRLFSITGAPADFLQVFVPCASSSRDCFQCLHHLTECLFYVHESTCFSLSASRQVKWLLHFCRWLPAQLLMRFCLHEWPHVQSSEIPPLCFDSVLFLSTLGWPPPNTPPIFYLTSNCSFCSVTVLIVFTGHASMCLSTFVFVSFPSQPYLTIKSIEK